MSESGNQPGRSKWLYIGSLIILVIVVVSFVGAPLITSVAGSGRLVFGRYNGEDIQYQPGNFFGRQYEAIAQTLRDSGNSANLELQLRIAWREAFNRAVLHAAVLQSARQSGIDVSSTRVDELMAQDPRFQVQGRFDAREYQSLSNQQRFALREFHREIETFNTLVADVLDASFSSEAERSFVAAMSGPERSFNVVEFPFSEFPDQQVQRFANQNPDLFVELNLAVVTLPTEEEALQILEQASTPGNPIADLARTFSRDIYADQGGQIGSIQGFELQQELLNPEDLSRLLSLQAGELSGVVETTAGWAFYEAASGPTPFDPAIDGAIEVVSEYMQTFEQGTIQDYVTSAASDFVSAASGVGMEIAAADAGLDVVATPFFPINYGNLQLFGQVQSSDLPDLSEAAFRESFFEAAFALQDGDLSEPIPLRRSVIVLSLREEQPANEGDISFVSDFYTALTRQFQSDSFEDAFVDEALLDDRFSDAFTRYVLGSN